MSKSYESFYVDNNDNNELGINTKWYCTDGEQRFRLYFLAMADA